MMGRGAIVMGAGAQEIPRRCALSECRQVASTIRTMPQEPGRSVGMTSGAASARSGMTGTGALCRNDGKGPRAVQNDGNGAALSD